MFTIEYIIVASCIRRSWADREKEDWSTTRLSPATTKSYTKSRVHATTATSDGMTRGIAAVNQIKQPSTCHIRRKSFLNTTSDIFLEILRKNICKKLKKIRFHSRRQDWAPFRRPCSRLLLRWTNNNRRGRSKKSPDWEKGDCPSDLPWLTEKPK